jgi:protein-S-isoprenylcysteine O-methyltransferase Ste14
MDHIITIILAYLLVLFVGIVILRIYVRRDYLLRGKLSVTTAILQALLFFVYGGLPILYVPRSWPKVFVPSWLYVIGSSFIVIGLLTLVINMSWLGISRSLGRGTKKLVQTGLYRITRNPQALACGLYVIGFSILWPSLFSFGWAILYCILIHIMVLTEEEHLAKMYVDKYLEYLQQVPRYIKLGKK